MSTEIDNKVVSMEFDNARFERNVQTSLGTIDKLNQSLELKGAAKGFEGVSTAAKNVDMSGLGGAIETVSLKFNALYSIADQVLRNITNSAMMYGKRIVSALTIDPVKTGLSEYETQIGAIQTILANTESKGSTLDDVNNALDALNTYADKTIYNFTEMTRNIGTFTAAGVDLDTSVNAIKGIANLAAVSGSTSQQASTAMYQLSQALSSGTVKLMDWNSVVNAGMGGQVFQDALKETARVQGVAIDDLIAKHGSFRETLQEGWLTSEVLLDTLDKFTMTTQGLTDAEIEANREKLRSKGYTEEQIDAIFKLGNTATGAATEVKTATQLWDTLKETAQSGWTQTWEIIMGDFEEAKKLFSGVYNTIAPMIESMSEARNEMLENWKVMGGRQDVLEAIKNAFEGVLGIVAPVKEAFREIFPKMTSEKLVEFSENLKKLTERFKETFKAGTTTTENLKRTFKGVFAALDIGRQIIMAVFKALGSLFGVAGDLGGGLLNMTAILGDWLVKVNDSIRSSNILTDIFKALVKPIVLVFNGLKKLFSILKEKFMPPDASIFEAFLNGISSLMSGVVNAARKMKDGISSVIDGIGDSLTTSTLFQVLQHIWKAITAVATGAIKLIQAFFSSLSNGNFSGFMDLINSLISGGVGVSLIALIMKIKNGFDGFGEAFEGIGDAFEGFGDIIGGIGGSLEAFQNQVNSKALMNIAIAVAVLAGAILILSLIEKDKMENAIGAISVLFAELLGSMAIFTKIGGQFKGVVKACSAMIGVSVAVLILATALKKVASMEVSELMNGLIAIAGLMAIAIAAMKILGSGGKTVIKGAGSMIMLALAVKILASVCKDLAGLSLGELAKGLIGVGAIFAALMGFVKVASGSKKMFSIGIGLLALAVAMKILASAVSDMAELSGGDLIKGLAGVGGLLAALMGFIKVTSGAKKLLSMGIALIAIAAAMKIFASAMGDLAGLSWNGIAKGLVAMSAALVAIIVALNFMPKNLVGKGLGLITIATALLILSSALTSMGGMSWESVAKGLLTLGGAMLILAVGLNAMSGTVAASASLLIAAVAIGALATSFMIFSMLSWESIIKGMVAIAGTFVIIGAAAYLLSPAISVILALSAALAIIGVGMLAVGTGALALATAFSILVATLTTGTVATVAALTTVIVAILELVPLIATKIGEGIIALAGVIAQGAPAICQAIAAVIVALLDTLKTIIPPLMEVVGLVITETLKLILTYVPKIVETALQLIIALLEGIAKHLDDIILAAVAVIEAFMDGIAKGVPRLINAGMKMIIDFINGLADAIRVNTPKMIAAVNNLTDAVREAIWAWIKNSLPFGGKFVDALEKGIKNGISGIKQAGKDVINGFVEGIKSKFTAVANAAKTIGKKALNGIKSFLGIKSPSREFIKIGEFSGEGMAEGLLACGKSVANASKSVGNSALKSMTNTVSGISDAISDDLDANPTIRPVLDLSDVKAGAGSINSMFGDSSVGVMANVGAISSMMNGRGQNGGNDDVVSAIDKLRKDLGKVGGDTYNINGVSANGESDVEDAIKVIVRAARVERRA